MPDLTLREMLTSHIASQRAARVPYHTALVEFRRAYLAEGLRDHYGDLGWLASTMGRPRQSLVRIFKRVGLTVEARKGCKP